MLFPELYIRSSTVTISAPTPGIPGRFQGALSGPFSVMRGLGRFSSDWQRQIRVQLYYSRLQEDRSRDVYVCILATWLEKFCVTNLEKF